MSQKMKLLFVMDPLARLQIAGDTTFAIMLAAQARGHDIWFCEPRHLSLEHADPVARAWPVTVRRVVGDHYLLGVQTAVPLKSCDAVLMRKDPPFDLDYYFATLLLERARGSTTIINDPRGLREQNEKLAVLEYPDLCPPTVVTRETTRLRSFMAEQGGEMVVKPLDASGGFGVFHVRKGDPNTGAILEQATQLGRRWTMAQKYLPEVRKGDKRILLCDGEFLCAVLRVPAPDDARGNLHVGAKPMATKLDERDTEIVRVLGPRLRAAGHFFVGLDVIGGWLTEINVTSPTGILEANTLYNDTYEVKVVERLEQKTRSTTTPSA
ncbi:MAG TPA: glutathione synthase [Polyangia bacterium]|jgi:glutathione synthase